MRCRVAPWLALVLLGASAAARENPTIVLRSAVDPAEGALVGQRVRLIIDVLGADGWAKISRFEPLEVSGAQVLRTETQGVNLSEKIGGVSYTGQRYELSVYPRRAGVVSIPAYDVEVELKQWGAGDPVVSDERTPPVEFEVATPPGAEGIRELVTTVRLTAEQTFTPAGGDLQVGDAVARRITWSVEGVSGMALPVTRFEQIEGVGVYPAESIVTDRVDRGSLTGGREDEWTFVFEKAGLVRLPDVVVAWYDLSAGELRRETVAGLELEIAPNPALAAGMEEGVTGWRRRGTALLSLALIAAMALRLRRPLLRRWSSWRAECYESEPAYFRRFTAAARRAGSSAAGAIDAHRALMLWLDRSRDEPGLARLDTFLEQYGDAGGGDLAEGLNRALDGTSTDGSARWDGRTLAAAVAAARDRRAREQRERRRVASVLPELN